MTDWTSLSFLKRLVVKKFVIHTISWHSRGERHGLQVGYSKTSHQTLFICWRVTEATRGRALSCNRSAPFLLLSATFPWVSCKLSRFIHNRHLQCQFGHIEGSLRKHAPRKVHQSTINIYFCHVFYRFVVFFKWLVPFLYYPFVNSMKNYIDVSLVPTLSYRF